ncbi:MAG: HIT family protein [Thiotrichales bacterium]
MDSKTTECAFCDILAGILEASVIYEDKKIIAIVPLISVYPESGVIFPKTHIDHYTDLPKDLALHIMDIGFELGKKIMSTCQPDRIGMLVHGYGVPHAHLNVFPQNHPHDITSRKFATVDNGEINFGYDHLDLPSRRQMNQIAELFKLGPTISPTKK